MRATPVVSLVLFTYNRTSELQSKFDAPGMQTSRNFEVISVDQNADQRILPYLRQPEEGLEVRHIRQSVPDRSAARNAGILAVRGEWIGYVVL